MDQMRYPVRDDAGFPAACSCKDEERTVFVRSGFPLLGIQTLQEIHEKSRATPNFSIPDSTSDQTSSCIVTANQASWIVFLTSPSSMRIRILYHDHCFDGAASAAFFSRFMKERFHPAAEFAYTGMAHKASQIFEDHLFDGDENAIVDFKYSPNPKLTWWFDHHQSAFLSSEDAEHYRREKNPRHLYDPGFRSCTKYICTVAREQYGYEAKDLCELVHWADIIDGALYESAKQAVDLEAPAAQLVLVIEGSRGSDTVQQIIRWMQSLRLAEIMREPEIQRIYAPLYDRHIQSIDIIRKASTHDRGVVYFDLVDTGLDSYNKFIPYYLHPESLYTVSVSTSTFRTKVSVGSNPWAKRPLIHNLATICERYGGGGHAKVGAISFEIGEIQKARAAAAEIAEELKY
jgi:hypothetical protein